MSNETAIFEKLDKHATDIHELRTGHSNMIFRVTHLEKSKDEILFAMAQNTAEMNKEFKSQSEKIDTLLAENYRTQGAANAVRWTQTLVQIVVGCAALAAIFFKP